MAEDAIVFVDSGAASAPAPPARRISFHGNGLTLLGVYLVNLLLTLLTAGVYYFWARTRIRHYMLSQTEFERDRFAWHGTGKELSVGFLKLIGLFLIVGIILSGIQFVWKGQPGQIATTAVTYLLGLLLVPIGIVGTRRYRLSRVSWRGIRFSFRGRAREFIRIFVSGVLLSVVTLGLYYPFYQNRARRYLVSRSYFGATPFAYNGEGRHLFSRFLFTVLGTLAAMVLLSAAAVLALRSLLITGTPRLDLSVAIRFVPILMILLTGPIVFTAWASYAAFRHRYYWSHTTVSTASFQSTMTMGRLVRFTIVNMTLLVITLGLALPWTVVRYIRFGLDNVGLTGPLDLAAIQQDAQAAAPSGEMLGDLLGLDFFDLELGI